MTGRRMSRNGLGIGRDDAGRGQAQRAAEIIARALGHEDAARSLHMV